MLVVGWKAEWEWNTSEVQEEGEDSGVGMVKDLAREVLVGWDSEPSKRGGVEQLYW